VVRRAKLGSQEIAGVERRRMLRARKGLSGEEDGRGNYSCDDRLSGLTQREYLLEMWEDEAVKITTNGGKREETKTKPKSADGKLCGLRLVGIVRSRKGRRGFEALGVEPPSADLGTGKREASPSIGWWAEGFCLSYDGMTGRTFSAGRCW
jgi:hypothetical protein